MNKQNNNIVDPADFCRVCGGTGSISYERYNEKGVLVNTSEYCLHCQGTGKNTIIVKE